MVVGGGGKRAGGSDAGSARARPFLRLALPTAATATVDSGVRTVVSVCWQVGLQTSVSRPTHEISDSSAAVALVSLPVHGAGMSWAAAVGAQSAATPAATNSTHAA